LLAVVGRGGPLSAGISSAQVDPDRRGPRPGSGTRRGTSSDLSWCLQRMLQWGRVGRLGGCPLPGGDFAGASRSVGIEAFQDGEVVIQHPRGHGKEYRRKSARNTTSTPGSSPLLSLVSSPRPLLSVPLRPARPVPRRGSSCDAGLLGRDDGYHGEVPASIAVGPCLRSASEKGPATIWVVPMSLGAASWAVARL
jgi:hypothetical protein